MFFPKRTNALQKREHYRRNNPLLILYCPLVLKWCWCSLDHALWFCSMHFLPQLTHRRDFTMGPNFKHWFCGLDDMASWFCRATCAAATAHIFHQFPAASIPITPFYHVYFFWANIKNTSNIDSYNINGYMMYRYTNFSISSHYQGLQNHPPPQRCKAYPYKIRPRPLEGIPIVNEKKQGCIETWWWKKGAILYSQHPKSASEVWCPIMFCGLIL